MNEINVSLNIDNHAISEIADAVAENLSYSQLANEVSDYLDYGQIAENALDFLDFDDIAERSSSCLDYGLIAEKVIDDLDSSDIYEKVMTDIDLNDTVSNEINSILDTYDPNNNCSTGKAFTGAVKDAITFLFKNDKDFSYLAKIDQSLIPEVKAFETEGEEEEVIASLFNPDLVALNSVVEYLVNNYIPALQNDMIKIQMDMWARFVNSRISYIDYVKENRS